MLKKVIKTPPSTMAIVVAEDEEETNMALLCGEISVYLKVKSRTFSESAYYEHCRSCRYAMIGTCFGGKHVIESGTCRLSLRPEREVRYIPKEIPAHVMVMRANEDEDPYFTFFYVDPSQTPPSDGNVKLHPLLLGNVDTSGFFCKGSIRVDMLNFADVYAAFWNAIWTGDYMYMGAEYNQEKLLEMWSPTWQISRLEELDEDYSTTLAYALNQSRLDPRVIKVYPPGTYEVIKARDYRHSLPIAQRANYFRLHGDLYARLLASEKGNSDEVK